MNKISRENIITIHKANGTEINRRQKEMNIYLLNGEEVVHYVKDYRTITRDNVGQAYLIISA
jgi:hypothetical protein